MAVRYTRAAHTVHANDITLPENFDTLSSPDIDDWENIVTSVINFVANCVLTSITRRRSATWPNSMPTPLPNLLVALLSWQWISA